MARSLLKNQKSPDFLSQIPTIQNLEEGWREMSTKKTTKSEVLEVLDLFTKLYAGMPWFYGAYFANDDLGQHVDLHVNVEEMKANGHAIPGAPLGVKVCIFNGKRTKVVVS